jgi:hypothetical protein
MRKEILAGGIVAVALLTAVYEAGSKVPAAMGPGPVAAPVVLAAEPAPVQVRAVPVAGSEPLAIREAHADGGYWYYGEERRPK